MQNTSGLRGQRDRRVYFVPGELIFTIEAGAALPQDEALALVRNLIDEAAAERFQSMATELQRQRFGNAISNLFSVDHVIAWLKELLSNPLLALQRIYLYFMLKHRIDGMIANNVEQIAQALREATNRLQEGAGRPTLTVNTGSDSSVSLLVLSDLPFDDDLIAYLSADLTLRALRRNDGQGINLSGVAPNWFMAPAPIPIGSGGPGARPVPPTSADSLKRSHVEIEIDESSAAQIMGLSTKQIGQIPTRPSDCQDELSVLILDTVPPIAQLRQALDQYGQTNDLISELLTGLSPTTATAPAKTQRLASIRYYDSQLDPNFDDCSAPSNPADMPKHNTDIVLADHDYDMSDHGTFIAGLVAANTDPNVQIHLIEALNRCGVGTVYSLLWALKEASAVIQADPQRPVIINLSLMLSMPLRSSQQKSNDPDYVHHFGVYAEAISSTLSSDHLPHELFITPIKSAVDRLGAAETETVIVAAAGNDGDASRRSIPARVPAAFASVTGVGALNQNMQAAVYSNKADDPLSQGFDILGGELNPAILTHSMADSDKGILSVYTASHFPADTPAGSTPNETGWARWAGTSFATPLLATILAWERSCGRSFKDSLAQLKALTQEQPPDSQRLPYKQKQ